MPRTPKNVEDRAVHVTVSVPQKLKDRMTVFNKHVNWSQIAKAAFEAEVANLEANPPAEAPAPAPAVVEAPAEAPAPAPAVVEAPAPEAALTPAPAEEAKKAE